MSFPRAKIQRFNDVSATTPSPADYDVKDLSTPTGAVIPKSSRFSEIKCNEPRSPTSSNNTSVSSSSSFTFKTPRNLKRTKNTTNGSNSRITLSNEALQEMEVECRNKDQVIKDLIEQLEDLKEKQMELEKNSSEMQQTIDQLKVDSATVTETHKQNHQILIDRLVSFKEQCLVLREEYKQVKQQNVDLFKHFKSDIEHLQVVQAETIQTSQNQNATAESKLQELTEHIEELSARKQSLIEKYNAEIKQIKEEHKREKQITEENFALLTKEAEDQSEKSKLALDEIKEEFAINKDLCDKLIKESDDLKQRYTYLEETREKEIESELTKQKKTLENEFVQKFNSEIHQLLEEKQILTQSIEETGLKYNKTLTDYTRIVQENKILVDDQTMLKQDLQIKEETIKNLIAQARDQVNQQKTFCEEEIAKRNTYENQIQNLLDKMGHMSTEIEQFRSTIISLMHKLYNMEQDNTTFTIMAELNKLEVNVDAVIEKLIKNFDALKCKVDTHEEVQKNFVMKIQDAITYIHSSLEDLKEKLLKQGELSKELSKMIEEAEGDIPTLTRILNQENIKKEDLIENYRKFDRIIMQMKQLCGMFESKVIDDIKDNVLNEVQKEYLKLNWNIINAFNIDINVLLLEVRNNISNINQQYHEMKLKTKMEENESSKVRELEAKLSEMEKNMSDTLLKQKELEAVVESQELLIGPFRKQLEDYKLEHQALLYQKTNVEQELKQMGLKYAELLGHQNHRQKIKHLVDLKKKNYNLIVSNSALESKVKSLNKLIERLKKDLAEKNSPAKFKLSRCMNENKENDAGTSSKRSFFK